MGAAFTFDRFKLIEVSYKPHLDQSSIAEEKDASKLGKDKQYNISVSSNTAVGREKENKYRMELIIVVSGSIDAKIVLHGFFSGSDFYESNETERNELTPIGITLLLPIARSILASITAQDGSVPFLLPTVNVIEMLADQACSPEQSAVPNNKQF